MNKNEIQNLIDELGTIKSWMKGHNVWQHFVHSYPYMDERYKMNKNINVTRSNTIIAINYDYFPATRGAREKGSGVQLEPDEPASVEICKILLGIHNVTELLEPLHDGIIEDILQYHENN